VDEAGLTGEVNPIAKIPLDPLNSELLYDPVTNKSSTIFAGTTIHIFEALNRNVLHKCIQLITYTSSFTHLQLPSSTSVIPASQVISMIPSTTIPQGLLPINLWIV
jgi:hypothetical protein